MVVEPVSSGHLWDQYLGHCRQVAAVSSYVVLYRISTTGTEQ